MFSSISFLFIMLRFYERIRYEFEKNYEDIIVRWICPWIYICIQQNTPFPFCYARNERLIQSNMRYLNQTIIK